MKIPGNPSLLQPVNDAFLKDKGVTLFLLRIDLIHPAAGGNKLFKLKYNLEEAKKQNKKTLVTFGGAFSNHIAATAAAGKEWEFETIGIIRGEKYPELNPTLKFAAACGMQLHYVSREAYREKNTAEFIQSLDQQFQNYYLIPEGGSNEQGVRGCKEIPDHIHIDFDYICCACGTGATLAGILLSLKKQQQAIGFQSLKAKGYIKKEVEKWLSHFGSSNHNWRIEEEYHFGGYAKTTPGLLELIKQFEKNHGIQLDNVYTGKMVAGIYDLVKKGSFKKGTTIVAVHTGGLQGNEGYAYLRSV